MLKFKPENWPQCDFNMWSPNLEVILCHKGSYNRTNSLCILQQFPNSYLTVSGPRKCYIKKIYVLFCYSIWNIISLIWVSFLKCGHKYKASTAADYKRRPLLDTCSTLVSQSSNQLFHQVHGWSSHGWSAQLCNDLSSYALYDLPGLIEMAYTGPWWKLANLAISYLLISSSSVKCSPK